jgi:hypothetical protein
MFGYDERVAVKGTKTHVSINALLVVEQKSKLSFDTDDGNEYAVPEKAGTNDPSVPPMGLLGSVAGVP